MSAVPILCIRHGQTAWSLTIAGIKQ